MKKFNVLAIGTMAVIMASCGSSKPGKVVMNTVTDTVSYSIGMGRAVRAYKSQLEQAGIDESVYDAFIKGFLEAANNPDDAAKKAYAIGFEIGSEEMSNAYTGISESMFGSDSELSFNKNNYLRGFIDGLKDEYSIMTFEEADETSERLYQYFTELQFEANRKAGEDYLAKKAQEEGVVKTSSGLLYKVITEGSGKKPTATDNVRVKYRGSLVNGTVFDESTSAISLNLGQVISGWTEGLQLMSEGSKYELYLPYDLAYGERAQSIIKPYSALIFEVELVSVED